VEFPGAAYELLDGEAQVWPGLTLVPTPGHTAGHQTLIVETDQGRVALAGQSFNTTSEFASAHVGWQLHETGWPQPGTFPDWMDRLQAFDPVRILFAHDVAVWERGGSPPSPRRHARAAARPRL
jgi:N-acyl homoserine lactone hydrolase